jgi:hypothetical protein
MLYPITPQLFKDDPTTPWWHHAIALICEPITSAIDSLCGVGLAFFALFKQSDETRAFWSQHITPRFMLAARMIPIQRLFSLIHAPQKPEAIDSFMRQATQTITNQFLGSRHPGLYRVSRLFFCCIAGALDGIFGLFAVTCSLLLLGRSIRWNNEARRIQSLPKILFQPVVCLLGPLPPEMFTK